MTFRLPDSCEAGPRPARTRVAVLYGGRSPEHAVSVASGRAVLDALNPRVHDPLPVLITAEGRWTTPGHSSAVVLDPSTGEFLRHRPGRPGYSLGRPDVVFPVLHGPMGEDGTVQGLLELAGVPYVGCGVLSSAACMDKEWSKRVAAAAGLPIAPYVVLDGPRPRAEGLLARFGAPVFVKPARCGSSLGVSPATDPAELDTAIRVASAYDIKVIVEAGVRGMEVMCGVLELAGEPVASPLAEIALDGAAFFDYAAKYAASRPQFTVPARLDHDTTRRVREMAVAAFRALGCRGLARVDCFVSGEGEVVLNEVNTMPGFTSGSLFPQMWKAAGLSYPELIDHLIRSALGSPASLRPAA
ncbi:D-alanine--D-alanine ligase family protein [Sphaerisporangium sp. B11E5]|uniref:D-alanine--D-alanine ligase family protein n=1 Tax=Sphaerisporangium sp. B11E5 TaxID=3153563 RepID=UPI00325D507E